MLNTCKKQIFRTRIVDSDNGRVYYTNDLYRLPCYSDEQGLAWFGVEPIEDPLVIRALLTKQEMMVAHFGVTISCGHDFTGQISH